MDLTHSMNDGYRLRTKIFSGEVGEVFDVNTDSFHSAQFFNPGLQSTCTCSRLERT